MTDAARGSAWTHRTIGKNSAGIKVRISRPSAVLPEGLSIIESFFSVQDVKKFLEHADKHAFRWEGFERRLRVQRYSLDEDEIPAFIKDATERFRMVTGRSPSVVSIEEYPWNQLAASAFNLPQTAVTTFESKRICHCDGECACFSAQVSLLSPAVEHINRPKRSRQVDCWDLVSPDHSAGIVLEPRALFIKTGEFLFEWRRRISSALEDCETADRRVVLLKFHRLPEREKETERVADDDSDATFGYVPGMESRSFVRTPHLPPTEDMLTVIVTTSPIKSNPSTELLERTFSTFLNGGADFALKCRKVIVCDGCRQRNETVSQKHANIKQAMRNGIVDSTQAENYNEFKTALRKICDEAGDGSPFARSTMLELESRHGYGFALREALWHVKTPYVIVIQHDRTFMRPTPIREVLEAMWRYPGIKYVGINMRSNLTYRDTFAAKYGRPFMEELIECILRPPELLVDSNAYGPDSHSTRNMCYDGKGKKFRDNIEELQMTYRGSQHYSAEKIWQLDHPPPAGKCQMSLTPTLFWYDNVHITETAHYRDFIFNPKYKMVVRGGFVEDKLCPVIKKTVERLGLKEGHSRFGCFILDDHSGMFFTGHLDGGSYFTKQEKQALEARKREESRM